MKLQIFFSSAADFFYRISCTFAESPAFAFFILFLCLCLIVFVCLICFSLGRKFGNAEMKKEIQPLLKSSRQDAVKRSRAVLSGQMAEQIAPFLKGFPCNPADVRFVGKPLDFIGFPGAADGSGIKEILFIEVKTGNAALSSREKEIKDAVLSGKVRYIEYNPEINFGI